MAIMDRLPRFVVVNDDPIFAAITAHRAAIRKIIMTFNKVGALDIAARKTKEPVAAEVYRLAEKKHAITKQDEKNAERQLLLTKPTTSADTAALLKYALHDIEDCIPGGWADALLGTVVKTLDDLAKTEACHET